MESQSQTRLSNFTFTFRGQLTFSRHFLSVHPFILRISFCSYEAEVTYQCLMCCAQSLSRVWLCASVGLVACQAPVSMGFSRQEYWSGLPCPPPGDLPGSGVKPAFLELLASTGMFFTTRSSPTYFSIFFFKILWCTVVVSRFRSNSSAHLPFPGFLVEGEDGQPPCLIFAGSSHGSIGLPHISAPLSSCPILTGSGSMPWSSPHPPTTTCHPILCDWAGSTQPRTQ